MPPATSRSIGTSSDDASPGGFNKTLGQYASIIRWASSSSNAGHSMFTPEQLYYSLVECEDPNTRAESIVVKTAWYGKQTNAPRHEFIVVQVEDITIPGRINYLVLDRNAETGRGQSIIGSLATFQTIRANDAFKVPHDGDAKKLLKECQLTPHKYLEDLSFQPDKPLYLYELVALARFVHYRHPNYSALDSSCYLFSGLIWECLRLMRPLATYRDDLASQRGQSFLIRYTLKDSVIKEAYEHVQARISEIELIFRNRREKLNVGRANQDSEEHDKDSLPEFEITSETPLNAVVSYFRSNSVLRDYTTDLERADCSHYPLGIGGLADVYRATLNDGTMVAVKRMRSNLASEGKATKRTARELYTWSRLHHKNILDLLGLAIFGEKLAIISPWMAKGNIMGYVEINKELDRYGVIAQVVEAVVYLHGIDVVHGDLKGDNILVSDDGAIKLTDFGLTMMHEQGMRFSATDASTGTSRWMAPEMIQGEGVRSKETDVYALGMTMLQITTGKPPFHEIRQELAVINEVKQNRRPKRPTSSDQSQRDRLLWEILERCWVREPGNRPEASSVKVLISKLLSS